MADHAQKVLEEFLDTEFTCLEFADGIIQFILNENIRSGEYECNEYIVKKIDRFAFVVFAEYMNSNTLDRELGKMAVFRREELLDAMRDRYSVLKHAETEGMALLP